MQTHRRMQKMFHRMLLNYRASMKRRDATSDMNQPINKYTSKTRPADHHCKSGGNPKLETEDDENADGDDDDES